jgi:hypothetical protein
MTEVPRVAGNSRAEFRRRFLMANRPVVVTDGLVDSPSTTSWNLQYFKNRFGAIDVAVSGDFFSPLSVSTLAEFIDTAYRLEDVPADSVSADTTTPYLRLAHPTFGGVDFTTLFFDALQDEWQKPYFLPRNFYFSPFMLIGRAPNRTRFPEWGLFISPRGGVTGIHIDRTNDNTILASTFGRKVGFLFEPSPTVLEFLALEHRAREQGLLNAIHRTSVILRGGQPEYSGLVAHYFELGPGEVLFIPKRWAHEVFTTSACVSLTYNFIHFSDLDRAYLMHRAFGISFY